VADLALLVLTLKRRKHFLARLMRCLEPQLCPRVKVHVLEKYEDLTIGERRNILLYSIKRKPFLAFCDDDDLVADTYVRDVLKALESQPDVVGFRGRYYVDGKHTADTLMSVRVKGWGEHESPDGLVYLRTPNHLSPVRRRFAQSIGFVHVNHGEDCDYAMRLAQCYPHMRETFVNAFLYHYEFRSPHLRNEDGTR
jgi:hypothetical protein